MIRRLLSAVLMAALAVGLVGLYGSRPASAATARLRVGCVVSAETVAWMARHSSLNGGLGYHIDIAGRQNRIVDYLESKGYDVTVLSDADLSNASKLAGIDVLVLTYQFTMNGTPSKVVQRWVAGGGGIVAMLASPRIAPEMDNSPNTEVREHWVTMMGTEAFEWGPLSELWQLYFVNDPGAPHYQVTAWPGTAHPIVAGARALLDQRGLSSVPVSLNRQFPGAQGGGFEITRMIGNDANIRPVLTATSNDTALTRGYPGMASAGRYPAAVATEYDRGRAVYFTFCPVDFLEGYNNALSARGNQHEAAGALIESAIQWAGTDDGRTGQVVKGGRTYASLNVYNDGIYFSQYVTNLGNVSAVGDLYFRVYEPSGKLVKSWRHPGYVGGDPGSLHRYSNSYVTGRLKDGLYRVEFEYVTNYPTWTTRWREVAYVRRAQGLGIPTRIWGAAPTAVSGIVPTPSAFSPDADGRADSMWLNFRTDRPSAVTVKVYDANWKLVAQPLTNVARPASLQSAHWNGKRTNGTWLPSGKYYMTVYAVNTAGQRSLTAPVTVSYSR